MTPEEYIKQNNDFREYVERVSKSMQIPQQELLKHKMIHIVMEHYKKREEGTK